MPFLPFALINQMVLMDLHQANFFEATPVAPGCLNTPKQPETFLIAKFSKS